MFDHYVVCMVYDDCDGDTYGVWTDYGPARKEAENRLNRMGADGIWYTRDLYMGRLSDGRKVLVRINQHSVVRVPHE
jgi:hypothetical protein